MWLLNTRSHKLKRFNSDGDRPRYAILSHVWREEEVTLSDIQDLPKAKKMRGFTKIAQCCALALQDGYDWVWVDTCCIDKSSSAELSEAINSMYAWYGEAEVCYAFLYDVKGSSEEEPGAEQSSFRSSRWFTRGWTLQELIAPRSVYFLAKNWSRLGTKRSLAEVIKDVTLVDHAVLLHERALDDVSVARRMSWAAHRETTRVEDRAYSLMGMFGVNMPTIYGEGEKAFIRLQLEIIRQSPDQTIFAWGRVHGHQVFEDNAHSFSDGGQWTSEYRSLLASSPKLFSDSAGLEPVPIEDFAQQLKLSIAVPEYYPTNYGIHIHLPLYTMNGTPMCFALLACRNKDKDKDKGGMVALLLRRVDGSTNRYYVGLYGLYRPLQQPWHPYFRIFRVPTKKEEKKAFLSKLKVADLYLHGYNPNPQRSRELGITDKQLRLHQRTLQRSEPKQYTFIFHGWLLKRLETEGFRLPRATGKDRLPALTPSGDWTWQEKSLTLTICAPEYRHAAVLFRGPGDEAFILAIGVIKSGLVWADGLVKGSKGTEVDEWKGSGHKVVKAISGKYDDDTKQVENMRLNNWKFGAKKFGDVKARAVQLTFTSWLAGDEQGVVGKGTVTYTVGIELKGKMYLEASKRLSSSNSESPSTFSRMAEQ